MTENEWKLRKELAQTKMALMHSQSILVQKEYNEAKAENEALGNEWVAPVDNVVDLKPAAEA